MKTKITLLAVLFILSTSCKEDILDIKNQTQYSDQTYFKEASQFNEALVATYAGLLQNGLYARDFDFIIDLLGNDAENNTFLLGDMAQLHDFSFGSSNGPLTDLWKTLYRIILRANLVIDKAAEWNPVLQSDIDKKSQYVGEARFLRGFAYFQLVNLWGRVPLKLKYSESTEIAPRASLPEIWSAIESDFSAATSALPLTYGPADLGRVTKGAATAMLGKAYLYQRKFNESEVTFKSLTQSPFTYSLNSSYDDQFSVNNNISPESVFDIQHKWSGWGSGNQYYMFGGQEAWGGQTTHTGRAQEYGWNDWNNVILSTASVNAFKYKDQGNADYIDPRAKFIFYGDASSGGDTDFCNTCTESKKGDDISKVYAPDPKKAGPYPYPFNVVATIKYNWRKYEYYESTEFYGGPASEINTQVVRYADVLMMLAESLIENNKVSEALPLINQVRKRSGAFEFTTLGDKTSATNILRRERQIEFCGEQIRWFDLNRWGIAKTVLNAEKQVQLGKQPFLDKNVLLPIPAIEKSSNILVASDAGDWN